MATYCTRPLHHGWTLLPCAGLSHHSQPAFPCQCYPDGEQSASRPQICSTPGSEHQFSQPGRNHTGLSLIKDAENGLPGHESCAPAAEQRMYLTGEALKAPTRLLLAAFPRRGRNQRTAAVSFDPNSHCCWRACWWEGTVRMGLPGPRTQTVPCHEFMRIIDLGLHDIDQLPKSSLF